MISACGRFEIRFFQSNPIKVIHLICQTPIALHNSLLFQFYDVPRFNSPPYSGWIAIVPMGSDWFWKNTLLPMCRTNPRFQEYRQGYFCSNNSSFRCSLILQENRLGCAGERGLSDFLCLIIYSMEFNFFPDFPVGRFYDLCNEFFF